MRSAWIVCAGVLLVGCQALPVRAPDAVDDAAAWQAQRQRVAALGLTDGDCNRPGWAMSGRVAVADGAHGGSAKFEWTQAAGQVRLQLSVPITRQSWVLETSPHGAVLQSSNGDQRHGSDPERLLRDATGWELPLAAFGCWLRAAPANAAGFGEARITFAPNLHPRRIEQGGWTLEYSEWAMDAFSGLPMPSRIEAQQGSYRVRLIVDRWGVE